MWKNLSVDFVTPPFAGHLFPILQLADHLRQQGMTRLRILSTADATRAVELCGLSMIPILPGDEDNVRNIADTKDKVGSSPVNMIRQFRKNLALMGKLKNQLQRLWTEQQPNLAIVDFTIPVAGLSAQSMGIPWWTTMPSPCVLETRTGIPAYLGGWGPRTDIIGKVRNSLGRTIVSGFKQSVRFIFAKEFRDLSIPGVYREDGRERAYSPERILGIGMREFEFNSDWPEWFEFIGPLTKSPPFPHTPPQFTTGKRHILVSLGTHILWNKEKAAAMFAKVAEHMPDCQFHFTFGKPGSMDLETRTNISFCGYIPYDEYLSRYDAAVIHGGTGVTYSCIKAGVPILVWPQDYDQFDHAARIVHHGLGLRMKTSISDIKAKLYQLMDDKKILARVQEFQRLAKGYDAGNWITNALQQMVSG